MPLFVLPVWEISLSVAFRISDHLHTMFEVESPPWDVEKKYKPESLEVYFEDVSSEKLCLVKNNKCLKDVLSDSRYLE